MQIEIKNIAKKYKRKQVLQNICLTAETGSCIGILGANGCGKSTLLSILARVQSCNKGSFLCDGVDLLKNAKEHNRLVGYVPQGTPLIEELSARDNLLLWYDIATGMRTDVRKARKRRIAYAYNNTRRKHGNNENSLSRLRRKSRKETGYNHIQYGCFVFG